MDSLKKLTDKIQKFYSLVETHDSQIQDWIKETKKPLHSITNQSAILRAALPKDSICNTPFEQFEGFRESLINNILTSLEEEFNYLGEIRDKIDAANEELHKEQKFIENLYTELRSTNFNFISAVNPSSPSFEHIVDWCYSVWCYYHSFYLQISQALARLNYEDKETVTGLSESFKESSECKKTINKIRSFNLQSFEFLI